LDVNGEQLSAPAGVGATIDDASPDSVRADRGSTPPEGSRRATSLVWAFVAFVSTCYYVAYNLRLAGASGLYYDELIQVAPAMEFLHPSGNSPWSGTGPVIGIGSHRLALMTMPYIGAVKQVLLMPVLAIWGASPLSIRGATILGGLVAVLLTYGAGRLLAPANRSVAAIAVVLLTCDPAFSFYTRIDYGPTVVMTIAKLAVLDCGLLWARSGRIRWVVGCGLAAGIGVYDKSNFVWILVALGGAAIATRSGWLRRHINLRVVVSWFAGFLAGSLPFWWFNLSGLAFPTLESTRQNTDVASGLVGRLRERVTMLGDVLTGRVVGPPGGVRLLGHQWWIVALVSVALALVIAALSSEPRVRALARSLAFLVTAIALVVVAATLTPGGFAGHHLILTYPFPHLALAVAVTIFWRAARQPGAVRGVSRVLFAGTAVVVVAIALLGVRTNAVAARAFEQTGGVGNWSDAPRRAIPLIDAVQSSKPLLAADWGISLPLYAYRDGGALIRDVFPLINDPSQYAVPLPNQPFEDGSLVLLHSAATTNFPVAREAFFKRAAVDGYHPVRVASVPDKKGDAVIELWQLRRG
jgi:hypothetical protein